MQAQHSILSPAHLIFMLIALLALAACTKQPSARPPTQLAAATTRHPTAIATPTNTLTPSPASTATPSPTSTATPSPTSTPTRTPFPTSTPALTPFPPRFIRLPIPTITLFPTVTPNYTSPDPKPVFLSLDLAQGDGIEMPYYIEGSYARQFFIYADGQVVVGGYQEGQLSARQMCDLKEKISTFGMFDERESALKPDKSDYGQGYQVQFEGQFLHVSAPAVEFFVDEIAAGISFLKAYEPPVALRPYQPSTVVVFAATAEEGGWYSFYYPEGGLTDADYEQWPDTVPPLSELMTYEEVRIPGSTEPILRTTEDYVSMAAYSDEFIKLFKGNYRTIHWFQEDSIPYMVIPVSLWPHDTPRDIFPYTLQQRDYVPSLDCDETPNFVDLSIPTPTPTLVPAVRSYSGFGKVLFTSDIDGDDEIFVMNADGTNRLQLTNNLVDDFSPVWSPDGNKIAFVSENILGTQIYMMNSDGSNVTKLTSTPLSNYAPSWSPDGTKLVFSSNRESGWRSSDIWTMNADGTDQQQITNRRLRSTNPVWSPDGLKIAFIEENNDNYPSTFNTVIVDWEGNEKNVFKSIGGSGWLGSGNMIAWSPDSQKIVSVQYRGGEQSHWVVTLDLDSSLVTKIISLGGYINSLRWMRNGTEIMFSAEEPNSRLHGYYVSHAHSDSEIYMFNLETNVLTQITYTEQSERSIDLWP